MDVVSSQLNLNEDNSNQSNLSHFSNQSDQSNLSRNSLQSKHSDELNQLSPTVPIKKPKRSVPRLKKKRTFKSDESGDSDVSDDSDYTPVKKYRRFDGKLGICAVRIYFMIIIPDHPDWKMDPDPGPSGRKKWFRIQDTPWIQICFQLSKSHWTI